MIFFQPSYNWKFGCVFYTRLSVNFKPKIWGCTKQFFVSNFSSKFSGHFQGKKHVNRVLKILLILNSVHKTDV